MTPELRELYQNVIVDHQKRPRNFRRIADADRHAAGDNPLCGDRVEVFLKLDADKIRDIAFVGAGCAICTAAASLMTEALKDKSSAEVDALFQRFHDLLTVEGDSTAEPALGKLAVFAGVRQFPVRVKCAMLPWHTVRSALRGDEATVSTE
jgi:nitrogen fixation NifU-like protein